MKNKDKAKSIADLIHKVLSTCGADGKNCVLEKLCDDLDILYFQLLQAENMEEKNNE